MIFSSIIKFFFISKLTYLNFSILRIFQILEIKKLKLAGSILDVGSKKSISNVTNFLPNRKNIIYLDNFSSNNSNNLNMNLEFYNENIDKTFDNVFLMNVLEHIYNYQNCINNCFNLLSSGGLFFGSTPFIFVVHPSPNDYYRYTEQSLRKSLEIAGFKNIKIKVLGGGIFLCFYTLIFNLTKKIPFFNNFLIILVFTCDKIINVFSKNIKNITPVGYFFTAQK